MKVSFNTIVGNMLLSALFVIYRIIIAIFVGFFVSACRLRFVGTFLTYLFVDLVLSLFMWAWTKIGLLLVMHASRAGEYEADKFAAELGYGDDLAQALNSIAPS